MKVFIVTLIFFFSAINCQAWANQQSGLPIDFVGGCEIDLNADGNLDSALLISTTKGYELIVVMRFGEDTKSYVVTDANSRTFLTCHYGKEVKATDAGPGKGKGEIYQINGAYLMLTQPESSSAVYFLSHNKFKEVWLSD